MCHQHHHNHHRNYHHRRIISQSLLHPFCPRAYFAFSIGQPFPSRANWWESIISAFYRGMVWNSVTSTMARSQHLKFVSFFRNLFFVFLFKIVFWCIFTVILHLQLVHFQFDILSLQAATISVFHTLSSSDRLIFRAIIRRGRKHNLFLIITHTDPKTITQTHTNTKPQICMHRHTDTLDMKDTHL